MPRLYREGPVIAGDYEILPPEGSWNACYEGDPTCVNAPGAKSISVTLTVPSGWDATFEGTVLVPQGPHADEPHFVLFDAGGPLYADPCLLAQGLPPTIPVDPTSVDSFVDAIAAHPLLDASDPTAVSLGEFDGKYVEVTAPADISACAAYQGWIGLRAQAASQRWRLWVIGVDGTRLVVNAHDFPWTTEADRTEMEAIVDSVRFVP